MDQRLESLLIVWNQGHVCLLGFARTFMSHTEQGMASNQGCAHLGHYLGLSLGLRVLEEPCPGEVFLRGANSMTCRHFPFLMRVSSPQRV